MKNKSSVSMLAAAALSTVFSTSLAAQEGNDTFPQGPKSSVHASPECIIEAMRQILGAEADIDSSLLPGGLITAVNVSEDFYRLVEVSIDADNTVTGLSTTVRDGATWDYPSGTGSITYEGMTGTQGFILRGLDPSKVTETMISLDENIRRCNPLSSLMLS